MLFSSITFLFYFLPIVLLIYFITPIKYRNYILLVSSLVFYSWGGLQYLPILLISILMNYIYGLLIEKNVNHIKIKNTILILSIISNILFLGIFKYSNFIIENINSLFSTSFLIPKISLPIGISFYTFQAMSYVIDVYRKDGKVQKNILNLGLYICMFPQLVAGPIVRYQTIDEQISSRTISFQKFNNGMERFIIGLFKKVIISNSVGELCSIIYAMPLNNMSIFLAWLGAISYALQIYFDFSGYSDMAIGLGKMLGFDFLENFNYPYISKSVGEFWRRWHISLGSWFRDYIYIPLGGNRVYKWKIYRNLLIVWFITGFWHGASWNFIIWGLYFGFFIMLERAFINRLFKKVPSIFQHIYLLLIIIFGWVIFSQSNMNTAIDYIKIMIGIANYPLSNGYDIFYFKEYFIILIAAVVLSTPIIENLINNNASIEKFLDYIKPIIYIILFLLAVVFLVNSNFNPFIYFNF